MSEVPEEQLETALEFMEWAHGSAIELGQPDEAHAYYVAIGMVEDAMDKKLLPPDEVHQRKDDRRCIKTSRAARRAGYREATLLGKERDHHEPNGGGFVKRFFDRFL